MNDRAMERIVESEAELLSLERFLVWSFRATLVALATLLGIYLFIPLTVSLVIAAVAAVNCVGIHRSIGLVRAGDPARATLIFAIGTWCVAATIGVLVPISHPMTLMVAYLPLALVIPYGSPRLQRSALPISVLMAILIAGAAIAPPLVAIEGVPDVLSRAVNVFFVSMVTALFCVSISGNLDRLQNANRVLRRSHAALRESERLLEQRVIERTEALERSSRALAAARDDAVSANETKSRLLAAASHDLRQPIHAMRLFAEALSAGAELPRNREIAQRIRASAETLTAMFDALLDLSRLEAGAVEARPIEFLLGPLVRQLVAELEPEAAGRGIELRFVWTNAIVRSDPMLLRRILQNLLVNAMRHTERGRVLVGCRRRGVALRVEVWDTGPGIPEPLRGEIFREFVQLEHGRSAEGLGLGLSIVERLAKLLGSRVSLDSRVGRGSVFGVEVPLADRVADPVSGFGHPDPRGSIGGLSVLVIDDDLQILESMRVLLDGWGCRALLARSSEEALELLPRAGGVLDSIVADYSLARGEIGLDAIGAVGRALGRAVPAIVITGEMDPEIAGRIRAAGHLRLTKPIRPAKLRAALASTNAERLGAESLGPPRAGGGDSRITPGLRARTGA